jgi:hypothetical protein
MAECWLIHDVTHHPALGRGAKDGLVDLLGRMLRDYERCFFEIVSIKGATAPQDLAPLTQVPNTVCYFFCDDLYGRPSPQQAIDLLFAFARSANHDTSFAGQFQKQRKQNRATHPSTP